MANQDTDTAWQAFNSKNYSEAKTKAQQCVTNLKDKALQDQQALDILKKNDIEASTVLSAKVIENNETVVLNKYNVIKKSDLNDVAIANFIIAESLRREGNNTEAKNYYKQIVDTYKDSYCWDPRGWYWNVKEVAQDKLDTIGTAYDYGDYTSQDLATKSWNALKAKDTKGIDLYAKKCLALYGKKAEKMQSTLSAFNPKGSESNSWALNDVATCYFMLGEKYMQEGNDTLAKGMYQKASQLGFAVCWDPRGWYWKVADVAKDKLNNYGTKYDFEDYTSKVLTTKGWDSLKEKDTKGLELYAKKCIYLFEQKATEIKTNLKSFPVKGAEAAAWAVNDVATCYYMLGDRYLQEGKDDLARGMFQKAADLGFAVCWDPKGWHWKVADVAKDKLDNYGSKYNYEDYRSVTLTEKAWKALSAGDYKGVELYTKKVIYLYGEKAVEMQAQLKECAKGSFAPYYWALNDVATCYLILGQSYQKQGDTAKAKEMFNTVINQYSYAQCWDPRGWYWKVAKISQEKIAALQ
jgi:tetratricopeptide (TPR) repeat protein